MYRVETVVFFLVFQESRICSWEKSKAGSTFSRLIGRFHLRFHLDLLEVALEMLLNVRGGLLDTLLNLIDSRPNNMATQNLYVFMYWKVVTCLHLAY